MPASRIPAPITLLAEAENLEIALLVSAGSRAYGLEVHASDEDWAGVFIAPLRELVSIRGLGRQTWTGDSPDFQIHEIGKFRAMALKGNPGILEILWNPDVVTITRWGEPLRALRSRCLHRGSLAVYVAYATSQLGKMRKDEGLHTKGGQYNSKFGMHLLRILHAGLHLGRTGEVMVRVPDTLRSTLLRVRTGGLDAAAVEALPRPLLDELTALVQDNVLPASPDIQAFDEVVIEARLSRA